MNELIPASEEDWFENVENLRPLRGGRRAETLNEVARGTNKITIEDAERKFRSDIEEAQKSEDPLSVIWAYTSWLDVNFFRITLMF